MHYVDLSHTIEPGMPVYPGTDGPQIEVATTVEADGFLEHRLSMFSHTGTHLDAPAHLLADGATLDELPIQTFVGSAFVLDARVGEGGEIELEALREHAAEIAEADFVLLCTGWDRYWATAEYFGRFPVLSLKAAEWLAGAGPRGVGVDAISVDPVDSFELPVHRVLLGAGLIGIENLTGLEALVGRHVEFWCLPLPTKGADGSPVRAVAGVGPPTHNRER